MRNRGLQAVAVAALVALVAPPGAGQRPLEERLQEAWRWRTLTVPGQADSFTSVRPWRDGGLVAVNDDGLLSYDGFAWRREPGWDRITWGGVRDVIATDRGCIVIAASAIASVDTAGDARTLWKLANPARISNASRLPDGTPIIGAAGMIQRVTVDGLQPLYHAPENTKLLAGLGCDASGAVLCSTDRGIFRRVRDAWVELSVTPQPSARVDGVSFSVATPGGLLFVPTMLDATSCAYAWDGKELHAFHDPDQLLTITDVTVTPEGELIAAEREPELQVWRDGVWHPVPLPEETTDTVQSLCMLAGGRLAVVLASGRLRVCDLESRRFEIHDPEEAGASRVVNALGASSRGGFWVATHHGLVRWDGAAFADPWTTAGDTRVELERLTAVGEDDRGRVWVGSGSGFEGALCLDGDRWTLHDEPEIFGKHHVHAIRRVGGDLWFTLLGEGADGNWIEGGFVRLRGDELKAFATKADGARLNRSYDICGLADGRVLGAAWDDVLMLQGDAWLPLKAPMYGAQRPWCMLATRDGSVWVGRGGRITGALRMRGDQWTVLDRGDWRHAAAASFCETADGRLWMASDFGLFLVIGDDCLSIEGQLLPKRNLWPMLADASAGLWLGGLGGGLVHFVPDDDEAPHTTGLDVAFTEEGHAVATWGGVDAWNDTEDDHLSFRVSIDDRPVFPDDQPGSRIQHTHSITFTDLEPGGHIVHVQAVDSLGNVEKLGLDKAFTVAASTWSSLPMLGAGAALAGLLAWLALVTRHRRRERAETQRRQQALAQRLSALTLRLLSTQEDERRSLSRELHDDLGQLLTTICMSVAHAQQLTDAARRDEALGRALDAARELLDRTHAISALLRPPELDDLGLAQAVQTAVADFSRRSGVDAEANVHLDGVVVPEPVAGHVYRVLQEALTNVSRHARAGMVDVTIDVHDGQIHVQVRDDGVGFVPEDVPRGTSYGLLGMRERAELLGGAFRVDSAPGAGTLVHVSIPMGTRQEVEGAA